jgi:4-amino-4-deoxy-L-arabinose transferase-like glycosyltransferase
MELSLDSQKSSSLNGLHSKSKFSLFRSVMFRDGILLMIGLATLFLVGLGSHPYLVPSEARYIEIPRQMIETGDWITPRLNGVKYFEKPPLFYWIQAAHMKYFGLGEFSGRFWTAMMMLMICMVTFVAATKKFGRLEGILSTLVLGSCILSFILSRIAMLDVPVSLCLTVCLFSFMFAYDMPPSRKQDGLLALMYAASGFAVLAKGLIGILIPAMIIGSFIALSNRWKLLLNVRLIPGLFIFLLVAAPWHILAGQATPEFYHFYFIHEHFQRFLTDTHDRTKPFWFFTIVLALGFFPWTAFLYQSIAARVKAAWAERKQNGDDLYLLLWIVMPFMFFNISSSKLIPYIFPIFPALAIITGRYLAQQWREGVSKSFMRGAYFIPAIILVFSAIYPVSLITDSKIASTFTPIMTEANILTAFLFMLAVGLYLCLRAKMQAPALIKVILVSAILFVSSICYVAPLAATRASQNSVKDYAHYLNEHLKPSDEVAVFIHYPHDLPVYINRNVTVVDVFGEMSFGHSIDESVHDRLVDRPTFLERWNAKTHRIYILLRKGDLIEQCPFYCHNPYTILNLEGPNILVSNMPKEEI